MTRLPKPPSKKESEYAKRQAAARRKIEMMRELREVGLDPIKDAPCLQ
ncbi:hypothetical protein AB4562_03740 [Vibrio sp. 10N.222.54.A1]|nr:hypothetical protein [Vibrio sp. F13]